MTVKMDVAMTRTRPALDDLYATYAPEALRLAYLVTGAREQAEDLVHDAFVKVAGRFMDLRDPDAFGPYLKRTVVNLANSWHRRRKVERAYLERGLPLPVESGPTDTEQREELWTALRALPLRQRAAIVLRYYEDNSEEQIAEALGCARGTVKSLLSRGLDAMRAHVGGE